ncbi:MAG: MATE family efflux transporter [Ruminococcaceae bacterium]|nr:MATE family efflux transporter [Oscillospiraceae bacterium]
MGFLKKFIGDKAFYRKTIRLIIPIIIQQGITNIVNLLDNIMVGSLGTEPMSGVAIVNQIIFVFNLTIFGGISGVSIFGAQFFGIGDNIGVRNTFRFKFIFCVTTTILALSFFIPFGDELIMLFLDNEANKDLDLSITLGYALDYLKIAIVGLIPFMMVQVYTSTLRETGETVAPMIASVISIGVNFVLNIVLIFGFLWIPAMGVRGAALATVIARFIEMIYIVLYTHKNKEKYPFIDGVYRSLKVPLPLVGKIIKTGTPLLLNEVLWSMGTTFVNQNYSTRGLEVVAANNISSTVWNIFCIIMMSMGSAVSILVGQKLGAGEIEEAKDIDRKLIFLSVVSNTVIGILLIASAPFIPLIYNTEQAVYDLATNFLMVAGASLPIHAFIHVTYFTIRSGGRTFITFLFDSVYTWCVPVVISFLLCRFTSLGIVAIYFIVQFSDIIKICIGLPMLMSGIWAKNIIKDNK